MKARAFLLAVVWLSASALSTPAIAVRYSGRALCRPSETMIFSCQLRTKTVSICGQPERSRAVYRSGRRSAIELELTNLHHGSNGIARGGEEEIIAMSPHFRYVVYANTYRSLNPHYNSNRPTIDADTTEASNDFCGPYVEDYGLLVQQNGKTISNQACQRQSGINNIISSLVPPGDFVEVPERSVEKSHKRSMTLAFTAAPSPTRSLCTDTNAHMRLRALRGE